MDVRVRWAELLKHGASPTMKAAGFTKKASVWRRRRGSASQVVAFRGSSGNSFRAARYYLEAGWDLDETLALGGSETGKIVIGGRPVMHAFSVGQLVAGLAREWVIDQATDDGALTRELSRQLGALVQLLDGIDGPRAMLERVDLAAGFAKLERAQLRFLLGDREGALSDVQAVCAELSDRQGMALAEVLARTGLTALAR
jgi:hypothetical protein